MRTVASDEMVHVVPILLNQPLDPLTARARLRAGIRYSAPESHVVPDYVGTRRILERILDVGLLHAKVAVDITAIVRLVAFGHLLHLLAWLALALVSRPLPPDDSGQTAGRFSAPAAV